MNPGDGGRSRGIWEGVELLEALEKVTRSFDRIRQILPVRCDATIRFIPKNEDFPEKGCKALVPEDLEVYYGQRICFCNETKTDILVQFADSAIFEIGEILIRDGECPGLVVSVKTGGEFKFFTGCMGTGGGGKIITVPPPGSSN